MNKKKMGAWMTALFVAAAMVLPVGRSLAAEGDKPGILLGGEGLEGAGKSYVYFGEHGTSTTNKEPIYTRVLSTNEKGGLLLLSEYSLERVEFDPDAPYSNDWATSNAKTWCVEVYNGFTDEEKAAVLETTKPEEGPYEVNGWSYEASPLNGEHLYFLSAKEVINPAYGFKGTGVADESREAYEKGTTNRRLWWLRSAYSSYDAGASAVDDDGIVAWYGVGDDWGGRPAFRVNLDAVLFASPADGGKAGTVGALGAVGTTTSNDWKLTLKEGTDKRPFVVSNPAAKTVKAGSTLTLDYTGAKTGNNEYVSAMLMDGDGKPVYYGRMMAVTQADGEVDVTIPAGLVVGDYTLQIFNEQYNGDQETDYASAPVEIPLTVVEQANVTPQVTDGKITGLPGTVTQGEKVTFTAQGAGMDNLNPVAGDERWKPVSWSVNPSGDFSGGYTQSFETAGMKPGEHRLTITYGLERYDGSKWVDTDERETQSFPFTLLAAPPQGGGERFAATPGELTGENPGTGDRGMLGWLMAAGLSAFGAGGLAYQWRKRGQSSQVD